MKRFLLGLLMGGLLMLPVGASAEDIGSAVAWTKKTIHVPAYGYFANHGRCRTEDMVLVKVAYPNPTDRRFRCVHIDELAGR